MRLTGLIGSSALCGLLSTASAMAMTADEVWKNWKDFATSTGQTVTTAAESREGDTLVVSKASFVATEPDAKITVAIDELRFRELGDGSVEVTMSPTYPVTVEGQGAGGAGDLFQMTVSQTNLRTIASGTPENTNYAITADAIAAATTTVTEDGKPIPVTIAVTMTGAGGSYTMAPRGADLADLTSTFNASSLAIEVHADDQEIGSKVDLSASIGALATVMNGTFGASLPMENPAEAVKAGFAADMGVTYGPLAYSMNVTENGQPTAITGKSDGGALGFAMDKVKMAFKGGGKGVRVSISGAEIPFPQLNIAYAESNFDISLPVTAGPDSQNFTMVAKVIGLVIPDELWGMIDPAASIPRDPVTMIVDTNGAMRLDQDLLNEAAMNSGTPPGQIHALNIPALQLTFGGAEFTGNGALTFDNSDMASFAGFPAPTGKFDLKLVGVNGLLDKLVALGLLPADQLIMPRMLMGMYAKPGDGPDTLTSTLEFKDKVFFANGNRVN